MSPVWCLQADHLKLHELDLAAVHVTGLHAWVSKRVVSTEQQSAEARASSLSVQEPMVRQSSLEQHEIVAKEVFGTPLRLAPCQLP